MLWASFPNFLFAPVEKQAGGVPGKGGVCSLSWGVTPPAPRMDSGFSGLGRSRPSHLVPSETALGGCDVGTHTGHGDGLSAPCWSVASRYKGPVQPARREDWPWALSREVCDLCPGLVPLWEPATSVQVSIARPDAGVTEAALASSSCQQRRSLLLGRSASGGT